MKNDFKFAFYKWTMFFQLLFIILLVVFLVYMNLWSAKNNLEINGCLFYYQTKLLCPACGGTRAIKHLLNGAIIDAIRCNALLLSIIFFIPSTVDFIIKTRNMGFCSIILFGYIRFCTTIFFLLIIIFWIARNIPSLAFLRPV